MNGYSNRPVPVMRDERPAAKKQSPGSPSGSVRAIHETPTRYQQPRSGFAICSPAVYGRALYVLLSLALFFAGCDYLPAGPADDEGAIWNPTDANAPPEHFVPPMARFLSGPADGATLSADRATFTWTATTAGVIGYTLYLDGDSLDCGAALSYLVEHLDEGAHTIAVAARYPTGARTPDDSLAKYRRTFVVRAFSAPALYLRPRAVTIPASGQFSVDLGAAAFGATESARAKGVHVSLRLPAGVTYVSSETLAFLRAGGGDALGWVGMKDGALVVDLARIGDPAASPADSGGVVRLTFNASNPAAADSIRVESCLARNGGNAAIAGVKSRGAKTARR